MSGVFIIANGSGICQVDPSGGLHFRPGYACSGSGSSYLRSYLNDHFKENMTAAQAMELATKAMSTAIQFDKSSGGCIRLFNVCEDKTMESKFLDFYDFTQEK